jgi:SAM-dependent methyltransferase
MDRLIERTFEAEQRHFWFRGFKRFVSPLLTDAIKGRHGATLVDAGCGTGANLALLERYGRPFGLELYWRGLEFGRSRGVTRLTQGSVTELPYASASVDVIVSFDVLYCLHPEAEQSAIGEMFRVLKPGGSAIVNVAALDMLKGDHSVLGGEVHRYRKPELRHKLERAGFTVERLTYTNASLFPFMAAVRAFQRLRGLKTAGDLNGDFYVPPAPINALLSGALALEARLVAAGIDMPFGSSLLCLARKP